MPTPHQPIQDTTKPLAPRLTDQCTHGRKPVAAQSGLLESEQPRRFATILADPPWDIQQKGRLGASNHYDLMTLDAIKAMPIADLSQPDAHLWLWVTNATLDAGFDVCRAWGFTPRSPLTWIKPRFTLGNYLRNATEHLIFATRGTAPVRYRSQPTWMFAPLQDHSHKPEEQFAVIERVSPGPYLELFARRRPPTRADWSVWGNQIDSDVTIPGYPVPSDTTPNPALNSTPGDTTTTITATTARDRAVATPRSKPSNALRRRGSRS